MKNWKGCGRGRDSIEGICLDRLRKKPQRTTVRINGLWAEI
jgi:hypothetical protein